MTVNYHKLSQVVTPIAAVVPDVVLLPEQINTSHGNWYVAIYLESGFFPSISVNKTTSSSFLSAGKNFTVLPQNYINSSVLCHCFICRNLGYLSFLHISHWSITLMTLLLILSIKQAVPSTLILLVRHLHIRRWEIYLTKIQGFSIRGSPTQWKWSCIRSLLQPKKRGTWPSIPL